MVYNRDMKIEVEHISGVPSTIELSEVPLEGAKIETDYYDYEVIKRLFEYDVFGNTTSVTVIVKRIIF